MKKGMFFTLIELIKIILAFVLILAVAYLIFNVLGTL